MNAEVDRAEVTPQHLAALRSWRGKAQQLVDKMKSSNISEKLKKAQDQLINAMGDADIKLWEQQEFHDNGMVAGITTRLEFPSNRRMEKRPRFTSLIRTNIL